MVSRELVFFGRIAASFTHELKNVLAIVKETSGLMEDLLAVTPEGAFPHRERFARAVATMQAQVGRGVELATRMNRFAHAPDHPVATLELHETLDQVVSLAERLARIKGVRIETASAGSGVSVVASPVGVQLALFKALECCWTTLESGGVVEAAVLPGAPPGVRFTVRAEGAADGGCWKCPHSSPLWEDLQEAASSIGASTYEEPSGGGFVLRFPTSPERT